MMILFEELLARLGGLERRELARWVAESWVLPERRDDNWVFHEVDIARVELILDMRRVFNADRAKPKPWPKQDPWEYWTHLREHVAHIHIKDATWSNAKNDADYNWPGEGQGRVHDILKDALARGYDAGISIEPHMVVVFHDANSKANDESIRANFIEYGRRMEKMIAGIKAELAKRPGAAATGATRTQAGVV